MEVLNAHMKPFHRRLLSLLLTILVAYLLVLALVRMFESSAAGCWGPEHPGTLTSMSNLADTLWVQGELAGARKLREEALDVCRRVPGPSTPPHPTLPGMCFEPFTTSVCAMRRGSSLLRGEFRCQLRIRPEIRLRVKWAPLGRVTAYP